MNDISKISDLELGALLARHQEELVAKSYNIRLLKDEMSKRLKDLEPKEEKKLEAVK